MMRAGDWILCCTVIASLAGLALLGRWFRTHPDPPARRLTDHERELLTTGLAGFCKHGVGMLDNCEKCCPPRRDDLMSIADAVADKPEAAS